MSSVNDKWNCFLLNLNRLWISFKRSLTRALFTVLPLVDTTDRVMNVTVIALNCVYTVTVHFQFRSTAIPTLDQNIADTIIHSGQILRFVFDIVIWHTFVQ